jgi:hypothetical protein
MTRAQSCKSSVAGAADLYRILAARQRTQRDLRYPGGPATNGRRPSDSRSGGEARRVGRGHVGDFKAPGGAHAANFCLTVCGQRRAVSPLWETHDFPQLTTNHEDGYGPVLRV